MSDTRADLKKMSEGLDAKLRNLLDLPDGAEIPPLIWSDPEPMTTSARAESEKRIRKDFDIN